MRAAEEDARFDLGSAAHAVLLEGRRDLLAVVDAKDFRTAKARAERDAARAEGKIPVLAEQREAIEHMVVVAMAKLAACPDLAGIPADSLVAERTILWQDGDTWLRCRPDWMAPDHSLIVSYKTTGNAEPDAFTRQILGLGYDVQAAFELAGVKAATGQDARYVWLVQEVDEPYACSLIGLSPDLADLAESKYRVAVERWQHCLATNTWPAYPERICYIDAPAYARAAWTERENAHDNELHPVEGL